MASNSRQVIWSCGLIALLVSGPAIPAGAISFRTLVVDIGASTDAWEHSGVGLEQCLWIPSEQVFMPELGMSISAAERLGDTSLIALTDQEASSLLNLRNDRLSGSLAEQVLTDAIVALSAQRSRAYEQRQGSWSLADEQSFVGLQARRDALDERPMTFYLVRALVSDTASVQNVAASICGQTLLTDVHSTTIPRPGDTPQRLAMLVLLEAPPERSVARWTYPYGEQEAD